MKGGKNVTNWEKYLNCPPPLTMGLDYHYIIVLRKEDKPKLLLRLDQDAHVRKIDCDNCYTINFKLDREILSYLKHTIRRTEGISLKNILFFKKSKFPDYFPNSNLGKIGCIYFEGKMINDSELTFASFSAATTAMSVLFQKSGSIKEWFLALSKEVNAVATFLDMEDSGYRFVYRDGGEVDVPVSFKPGKTSQDERFYRNICNDYKKATYINFIK